MDDHELRRRAADARVARLATVRADGSPHLVPVCFALVADELWSAVDAKPKRTAALTRLRNVAARPEVSLLVDEYDDDWTRLWWVRVDGTARVVEGGEDRDRAIEALQAKYHQYAEEPPRGPALAVTPRRWTGWSAHDPRRTGDASRL